MADNIPEGLDDLLNSIRGEGKSSGSSALAIVPKAEKKESDSVGNEDIDPRILKLLGLEDVFDIDYDTYKTLLRERMAAGRMADSKIPTEEVQLLTDEFKRVKSKTGRFKVKSQKIKKESFVGKKKATPSAIVKVTPGALKKDSVDVRPETKATDETLQIISTKLGKVNNNVAEAIKSFSEQNKAEAKAEEKKRVAEDRAAQATKEEIRERKKDRLRMPNVLSKAMAPVKDLFGNIVGSLQKLGLATLVMQIIKFLENPIEYFRPLVDWGNGMIDKLNEFTKNFVTDTTNKINNLIKGFNAKLKGFQDKINGVTSKIPFGIVPPIDLGQIDLIDASSIANKLSIPHIPFPSASPDGTSATPSTSASPTVNVFAGKLLSSNAKTTYYDPSLGGINASGAKTASGLPATSTGEGYDPKKFTAAAFPELISKLPTSMTTPASGFRGGRTLARGQAFNVVVTSKDGKSAIIRVNDVGPGVSGHSANHLLDLSVAAKNYLGTGGGYTVRMAPAGSTPGPVQQIQPPSQAQLSSSSVRPTAAPPPPQRSNGAGVFPIAVPLSSSTQGGTPHSASNAGQKQVPLFYAQDGTNSSIMPTKALFNIVD